MLALSPATWLVGLPFSHGYMRVEKAWELVRFLLKDNTVTIDTIEEKGFIRNQVTLANPY